MNGKKLISLIALLFSTHCAFGAARFPEPKAPQKESYYEFFESDIPGFRILHDSYSTDCEIKGRFYNVSNKQQMISFFKALFYPSNLIFKSSGKNIVNDVELKEYLMYFIPTVLALEDQAQQELSETIDEVLITKADFLIKYYHVIMNGKTYSLLNIDTSGINELENALHDSITVDMLEDDTALTDFKEKILSENADLGKSTKLTIVQFINSIRDQKKSQAKKEHDALKQLEEELALDKRLFDLGIQFRDQAPLMNKIALYLKKQLEQATDTRDIKNRKDILHNIFLSDGVCAGLTTLWEFAIMTSERDLARVLATKKRYPLFKSKLDYIDDIRDQLEELSEENPTKDDIGWFRAVQTILLDWDGEREFTPEQTKLVERFIGLLNLFQTWSNKIFEKGPGKQIDLSQSLQNMEGFFPSSIAELKFDHASMQEIAGALADVVKPDHMIFFTAGYMKKNKDTGKLTFSGKHIIGIFESPVDKTLYFYNSNHTWLGGQGIVYPSTIGKLTEIVADQFNIKNGQFEDVIIRSFTFPNRDELSVAAGASGSNK